VGAGLTQVASVAYDENSFGRRPPAVNRWRVALRVRLIASRGLVFTNA